MEFLDYDDIADKGEVFEILRQLRSHLADQDFVSLISEALREGFRLTVLVDANQICCVMGYRIIHDLAHGKHFYIDDLVTPISIRSKGYGKHMIQQAEKLAKASGCKVIRLCSGIGRESAHRFYEREGLHQKSIAFKKLIT